jgi:hypothetical protein
MDRDRPITEMVEKVREMAREHPILIVTGRPANYRSRTEHWLRRHKIPFEQLFMRRNGDHRPDYEAKSVVLDEIPASHIAFAIDDRPPVCDMWESHGIKCIRVSSDEENQEVNKSYQERSSGATKEKPMAAKKKRKS